MNNHNHDNDNNKNTNNNNNNDSNSKPHRTHVLANARLRLRWRWSAGCMNACLDPERFFIGLSFEGTHMYSSFVEFDAVFRRLSVR